MKNVAILGAIAAASLMASAASGAPFPSVGNDTKGPQYIINVPASGPFSVTPQSPNQGAYDGVEDTYIGVTNNSGHTINSFGVSSSTQNIFGFDGDGLTASPYNLTGNALDGSGYGGPQAYFTNISLDKMSGTVNFIGGISNGGTAFFALEEALSGANGGINVGAVPEPSTWAMKLIGFAGLGFLSYRKSKQRNNVLVQA